MPIVCILSCPFRAFIGAGKDLVIPALYPNQSDLGLYNLLLLPVAALKSLAYFTVGALPHASCRLCLRLPASEAAEQTGFLPLPTWQACLPDKLAWQAGLPTRQLRWQVGEG